MTNICVRAARPENVVDIVRLMKQLAEFEGYLDCFKLTERELHHRLFVKRDFQALVADSEGAVNGLLVFYVLPFTYDLKPWYYLKELIVDQQCRSAGVGRALLQVLKQQAQSSGVSTIRWEVLADNVRAQSFYQAQGAICRKDWQLFELDQHAIAQTSILR